MCVCVHVRVHVRARVCVCVFTFGSHVFCPFATEIGMHARNAQEKVCVKKLKKIMHQVPFRGVDPCVKFFDNANATHSRSFEHTPTPVLSRLYATSSFAKLQAIEYLADETYSSSAFVSLQILIAFVPNPTYTFSAASATRGVCRFLSKQA